MKENNFDFFVVRGFFNLSDATAAFHCKSLEKAQALAITYIHKYYRKAEFNGGALDIIGVTETGGCYHLASFDYTGFGPVMMQTHENEKLIRTAICW